MLVLKLFPSPEILPGALTVVASCDVVSPAKQILEQVPEVTRMLTSDSMVGQTSSPLSRLRRKTKSLAQGLT